MMNPSLRKYVKVIVNLVVAIVSLLLVIFVLPKLLGFFMPFLVGWILAAIANPMVKFLDEKIRIKRKAGSAIVIIAVLALVILGGYWILSFLVREIAGFVQELPTLWSSLESDVTDAGQTLENLSQNFPPGLQTQVASLVTALSNFINKMADGAGTPAVTAVGNFARNIPSAFVSMIMCLLSAYFFVAQREEVVSAFQKYIPESYRKKWGLLYHSLKSAVGGYFKAQIKIEIWIYILLVFGLFFLKIRYTMIVALGIAVLDFLPVFGTGTILIPWALIKVLSGDYGIAIGLLIIWGVGQLVRQLIQPKIVGDSIGVPAIPTLFLLYIGYKMGSVLGLILAVPVGILLANMYQAGFFAETLDSLRILVIGFNQFRWLTPEDKKNIPSEKEKKQEESQHESSGL